MIKYINVKCSIILFGLTFLLFSLGFVLFNYVVFSHINNEKNYKEEIKNNIWGVVALTGGRNRIAKAIEFYMANDGGRMLISGVGKGTSLDMILKSDDIDIKLGKIIDLGDTAIDTVGNAKEVKEWSDKYNIDNVYVVTSFYHVPRAMLEIKRYNEGKNIKYIATSSNFVKKKWWSNYKSFCFLMKEYVKFLIVFVQYRMLGL